MTDFRTLCTELHTALEKHDLSLAEYRLLDRSAAALRAALAGPTPEGPTDEPMIPDHYRGDDIRVYREGFHAGYKYAFQLIEKHSDV